MSDVVTIKEIADTIGTDRSNARKIVLKNGFDFIKIRTAESKGQLTLALSKEDFESFLEMRNRQGFQMDSTVDSPIADQGYFYIIQIVPELDGNRIKFGFATDVQTRLQAHRTIAPTAQLVKYWPCKRIWEQAAIDSITRDNCTLIGGEVFQCEDLQKVLDNAEGFFSIMP